MDYLFAMLATVIANANRAKRTRPYKADQFMPKWDAKAPAERKQEMSGEDMLRAVKRLNRTMGG
jgi:hypothetical protein